MRLFYRSLLLAAVAVLAAGAAVWHLLLAPTSLAKNGPAPPPLTEPILVIDDFVRRGVYLGVHARIENHSKTPIHFLSTFGRPVLWAIWSDDGMQWTPPVTTGPGCGVGYYPVTIQPGESSCEPRGCNLTPLRRPAPPFVRFGVACFDGVDEAWSDGRVVWGTAYRNIPPDELLAVSKAESAAPDNPDWPRPIECRKVLDILRRADRMRILVTFESSSETIDVPGICECPAPFAARYRRLHGDRNECVVVRDPEKWNWSRLAWERQPDGKFRRNFEATFWISDDFQLEAVGIAFKAMNGEAVRFKRVWAELGDAKRRR